MSRDITGMSVIGKIVTLPYNGIRSAAMVLPGECRQDGVGEVGRRCRAA
jgi:hypothetical protein